MVLTVFAIARLILSAAVFLAALLNFAPPPNNALWKLSVIVLEGGYFVVIPCLLLALIPGGGLAGKIAAALFLFSAVLYATPLLRGIKTASRLEHDFASGFGKNLLPQAFHRLQPVSFKDLLFGYPYPRIEPRTAAYAKRDSGELLLDFYPAPRKNAPCIIVLHGGGWDSGDRKELAQANAVFASLGYAVAAIDYSLAPRHPYPAAVVDVKDALDFLRAHAGEFGIDPSRFVLLGRSAGGQIALQAAYTLKDTTVRGVISYYAPADMVWSYSIPTNPRIMNSRKLLEQYLEGGYPQKPENYRASSPLESVEASSPPALFLQGGADVIVSPLHVVHLEEKMEKIGTRYFTVNLPWATHAFDFVQAGPGSQISLYFVERFLAEVTR